MSRWILGFGGLVWESRFPWTVLSVPWYSGIGWMVGYGGTDREIIHRYCNPWILTMRKDSLSKAAGDHPLKLNLDKFFQSKFME